MSDAVDPLLGARYERALVCASQLHADQVRKDTDIPYLSHLLAVSSLVLEHGGDEDQAIAALLHDALEDQPERTSRAEVQRLFGADVARIVEGCSDTVVHPKPPWKERKQSYIAHLEAADRDVLLVSCADKLHNVRAILSDYAEIGGDVFQRFNQKDPTEHLRYYRSLAEVFARRLPGSLSRSLTEEVARLEGAVERA
jgi:(p)ppGpp synthase/HD superfamily hydrolase